MAEIFKAGFFDPEIDISNGFDDDTVDSMDYYSLKEDNLFHIREEAPTETVICKRCGGNEFNVGSGEYYTAIKCIKCKWEAPIHKG